MPEGHFARLREYADDAARQPDFDTIRRRAVQVRKRRRNAASTVVAGVTAAVVAAVGLSVGPREGGEPVASPSASASWDENAGWPRWIDIEAAGPDELYAVFERCRTCGPEFYVSTDAGRAWQRRTVPPAEGDAKTRLAALVSVAPGVLVWTQAVLLIVGTDPSGEPSGPGSTAIYSPGTSQTTWITLDGGKTWKRPEISEQPVDAVSPGTRPVDCGALAQNEPCLLYAVDASTGRLSPLATQPTLITYTSGWLRFQTDVPIGGQLWIPGLDPATKKPAVAASSDGGRTWKTHAFADGVAADPTQGGLTPTMYLPTVAADTGGTAYAMLYRDDHSQSPYRTTDGGATWQPVAGGPLPEVPDAGYLTADGAHVVKNGEDFVASRNGGRYGPVTLSGYPLELRKLTQVTSQKAAGRYVVTSGDVCYISDDGWAWRKVRMP
jgi:photosystem II stability/assembly factor-like uncharacterized protein